MPFQFQPLELLLIQLLHLLDRLLNERSHLCIPPTQITLHIRDVTVELPADLPSDQISEIIRGILLILFVAPFCGSKQSFLSLHFLLINFFYHRFP